MRNVATLLLLWSLSTSVSAQNYSGDYVIYAPDGVIALTLSHASDGTISGSFDAGGYVMAVAATLEDPGISGTLSSDFETLGFVARMQGAALYFKLFGFDAAGQPDYTGAQTLMFPSSAEGQQPEAEQTVGNVAINGIALSREGLASIQQQYGTSVPAGRYWYDAKCGAWGLQGGPTLGFVAAGLDLPGPMPEDISGGGTGIFINGREIHPQDQLALIAMLGGTYPGRYWLDAEGNLGVEGGAYLLNLVQVSRQQSGGKGGLYSGMGGTVGVDGSGGVLFYSKNASGGYTSWSN